jgi:hypothetical protein
MSIEMRAAALRAAASSGGMIYRPVRERDPEEIVSTAACAGKERPMITAWRRFDRGRLHFSADRAITKKTRPIA